MDDEGVSLLGPTLRCTLEIATEHEAWG
jgi:hypothetical protein